MGLSWQQGPLGAAPVGRFLAAEPLPERLLYAELYESGFAPRWYVPREDVDESALALTEDQTFCPYKSLASYYDIGDRKGAARSYPQARPEVARVSDHVSFEPDKIDVYLDGRKLALEPGQSVIPHGIDRGLDPDEILNREETPARV